MQSDRKHRILKFLAVPLLSLVLIVLAVLQYRWSNQVSAATRAQIESNLQIALMGFRMDLTRELGSAALELTPPADSAAADPVKISQLYRHWQDTGSHPALISHIYLWKAGPEAKLSRLDPAKSVWDVVTTPAQLQSLTQLLSNMPAGMPERHGPRPMPNRPTARTQAGPHHPHWLAGPPWFVDTAVPALTYPLHDSEPGRGEGAPPHLGWMIVELNASVLRNDIFPDLVQKYFKGPSGLNYHVAVVSGPGDTNLLYASDSTLNESKHATGDTQLNLFGPPFSPMAGHQPPVPGDWPGERNRQGASHFERSVRFEPLDHSPDSVWKLVVKHQRGSVEAAVNALRWRNLAVSFGVLLLLAASMAIILFNSRRANRIAQMQMDFVAGISHELRTPLAVISSAAENMAHGVIADKEQSVRYGNSILNQTRQLSHLVEQVLQFATVRQGNRQYDLRPTDAHEAVSAALEGSAASTRKAGVSVEVTLPDDLPYVSADFTALVQSLQNLITNAAKYNAGRSWMRISSAVKSENEKPVEVQISVADKGIGISPDDLKHVFEPFYRSPSVASSQIHGTGLGLALSRASIEAMGGRVTAESELGQGSVFTIHLPVAEAPDTVQERAAQRLQTPAQDTTS